MSAELKMTFGTKLLNGNLADQVSTETLSINQNVAGFVANCVSVTNVQTNADLGGINTLGYLYLKNISISSDFLQFGPISGTTWNKLGRLYNGESAALRLEPGTTLRWVGNSTASPGNCNTQKVLIRCYND